MQCPSVKKLLEAFPKHLTEEANELVKALGMKDRKQAETLAKGIVEGMRIQGKAID